MKIQGPLIVHEMAFAADAIAAGVGIGLVPEAYFGWVKMGGSRSAGPDLVRVLPDHRATGSELSLVSPPTAYEPARVGLLRDFLAERLRPMMQACTAAAEQQRTRRRPTDEGASPRRLTRPQQNY